MYEQTEFTTTSYKPIQDERLLERSMMARLLGLLSSERLASEMSAVTRVIVILYRHTMQCRSDSKQMTQQTKQS